MNLYELISKVEKQIAEQPNVRSLVRADIYKLNDVPNALYSVMGWTMGTHRIDARNGIATYALTIYYIDRNVPEANNEHMIVSFGSQVIGNVVNALADDGVAIDSYDLQPFVQRFADDCAGVYANLSVDLPIDLCYDSYATAADFNNDFNSDFLVGHNGIKIY